MEISKSGVLKIGSHNIQGGITKKVDCSDVCSFIGNFDILCVQETWLTESKLLSVPGYQIYIEVTEVNKINEREAPAGSAFYSGHI